jgi:AI-2 transport protein TqsA
VRVARNTQIHSLISLAAAVCTTFILLVFEVDLALFFGLLTFVLGYIPNIGPAVSIFLPLPMVILDPRPIAVRLIFIFIFLAATQVLSPHTPHTPRTHTHRTPHTLMYRSTPQFTWTQLVEPKVLGRVMNIPPVTIIVALLFWGSVWGIVGAIISVSFHLLLQRTNRNLLGFTIAHHHHHHRCR